MYYIPTHFEQPNIEALHELIRSRPLATLVTLSSTGINANHIPLQFSEQPMPFGILQGYVARANPIWNDLNSDIEVLAIFHGPDAYISPSWYTTKQETGKAVPTWNYTVVHAYGSFTSLMMPLGFVTNLKRSPIITKRLFLNRGQFRMRHMTLLKS